MKKQPDRYPSNTAVVDIETTNLGADFGFMLCAVVKPLRMSPKIFRWDDYNVNILDEDKLLVRAVVKELDRYQFIITYNGIKFDQRFINTRCLYHKIPLMDEKLHIDLLPLARRCLRMRSKRLEAVINFLEIKEKKTPLDPRKWRLAMLGHKKSMDEVVKHCIQDTKSLEMAYDRLCPLIKSVKKI